MPLVAALTGRAVLRPTRAQQRVQAAFITIVILMAMLFVMLPYVREAIHNRMPDWVHIASGVEGGMYYDFASQLLPVIAQRENCGDCQLLRTSGSNENFRMLARGEVNLALLQESFVRDEIGIVAPLYYEFVHVLVRRDSPLQSLGDLSGKRVAAGLQGSGMAEVSQKLLQPVGAVLEPVHFDDFPKQPTWRPPW